MEPDNPGPTVCVHINPVLPMPYLCVLIPHLLDPHCLEPQDSLTFPSNPFSNSFQNLHGNLILTDCSLFFLSSGPKGVYSWGCYLQLYKPCVPGSMPSSSSHWLLFLCLSHVASLTPITTHFGTPSPLTAHRSSTPPMSGPHLLGPMEMLPGSHEQLFQRASHTRVVELLSWIWFFLHMKALYFPACLGG